MITFWVIDVRLKSQGKFEVERLVQNQNAMHA